MLPGTLVEDRSNSPTPPPILTSRPEAGGGDNTRLKRELSPAQVNDFLYQLQDVDLADIGRTAYDLVIIDYSSDGGEDGEFSREQIGALRNSTGGPKIVLAYMSIGEAEDYRFYWRREWQERRPPWLAEENPSWPGNYKVQYWQSDWQSIIFQYADRLLDAGFEGVYLDIIDAYEYFAERGRSTAAQEMADFVAAIASYFRSRDPDFYIFPQNAPELAHLVTGYLDYVDGIDQEDLYYGYSEEGQLTPRQITAELEGSLDLFRTDGKLVLTVHYTDASGQVDYAYAKARSKGYVPFATVRGLNRLTVNSGYQPD